MMKTIFTFNIFKEVKKKRNKTNRLMVFLVIIMPLSSGAMNRATPPPDKLSCFLSVPVQDHINQIILTKPLAYRC